jgi:Zn-dependent peptidase ImmA (M78 family)
VSIRWERLAGDTASFAIKISFQADPDEGRGSDAETAASWGSLQVWVDGVNLCAHVDQGETLQGAHWYLLPTLEWIAQNWDPLFHEERLPRRHATSAANAASEAALVGFMNPAGSEVEALDEEQRYVWQRRHSLRTGRDGGVLPNVFFRRSRDRFEVSWTASTVAGAEDVSFLAAEGASVVDLVLASSALYAVVTEAVGWLRQECPASTRLARLASTLDALSDAARAEARLGWLAALREFGVGAANRWISIRDHYREQTPSPAFQAAFVEGVENRDNLVLTGSCQAALLFGTTSPTISDEDVEVLVKLLIQQYAPTKPARGVEDYVRSELTSQHLRPWEQGYDFAEDLHDKLGGGPVDISRLLGQLGIDVREIALNDEHIRAVSLVSLSHVPTIALNTESRYQGETARRFTLAHELCHLLYDREHGVSLAVASGPWAPPAIEQRANAFAAMLLMPPELLKSAISSSPGSVESLSKARDVATELGVSVSAFIEHAYNLGLIDEAAHDDLRDELRVGWV